MPKLKELREATGRSRAQVAADLQMSERHLYRLENAATPLGQMKRLAFASYYRVQPEDIEQDMAA